MSISETNGFLCILGPDDLHSGSDSFDPSADMLVLCYLIPVFTLLDLKSRHVSALLLIKSKAPLAEPPDGPLCGSRPVSILHELASDVLLVVLSRITAVGLPA